ncbi:MAG: hypothetical protein PCFJNLEI_03091 [Verrucomicrobiae bacterium]|nr:hypothetical protein [Verrucomicrobiae bacterium]
MQKIRHVRLHPQSLSPDPTYGVETGACSCLDLEPARVVRAVPAVKQWRCPVRVPATADGRVEFLLDFGTELDAKLELTVTTTARCHVTVGFGESAVEAEGLIIAYAPHPVVMWSVPGAGTQTKLFDTYRFLTREPITNTSRGFRYVRLVFHDVRGELRLDRLVAHAEFTFAERRGDFRCDDEHFQRAWQASVYTARLCARPAALWDGIKRDREGWFGDARITAETNDAVWHDPRPAAAMLAKLPTNDWCNGVPVYSFDAIAMLHQQVLVYGWESPAARDAFARIVEFLAWVAATQTNADGFIIRDDKIDTYFLGIGFLDWSTLPHGGRFEELSWLQCKYVEGLRTAAQLAQWLGQTDTATRWRKLAAHLEALIIARFWRAETGFLHTLNHAGPGLKLDDHYPKTYQQAIARGPSGPTRHCNALAVLAGIGSPAQRQTILDRVFRNPAIDLVTTPYFRYYEDSARALCGDPTGALADMVGYIGDLVEREDAATVWETYDPRITDLRRYTANFDPTWYWSTSLCHGWSSGLVPLTQRWLLGIEPRQPGFSTICCQPAGPAPGAFEATIPTPHGTIRVHRPAAHEPVRYDIPAGITVEPPRPAVTG